MEKPLMLTVVAWNYLFWVALRVCKISGISGLSFPRFRHKLDLHDPVGLKGRSIRLTKISIFIHRQKFPSPLFQKVYSKEGLVPSLQRQGLH